MVVPRTTLTPGTYTFILDNPETSRDVVSILREDGTPVTSAHVARMQRGDAHRDLAVGVAMEENGAMPVMKGWFYPALTSGYAFLPKDQAQTIARAETVVIPVAPRGGARLI